MDYQEIIEIREHFSYNYVFLHVIIQLFLSVGFHLFYTFANLNFKP